jgi:hypothetical protein
MLAAHDGPSAGAAGWARNQQRTRLWQRSCDVSLHRRHHIVRETNRNSHVSVGFVHHFQIEGPPRPGRIARHVACVPDIPMNGSLLDLDVAAGLDVQHRSCGEGQRDVRVENQPEVLVVAGRSQQKTLELGIERPSSTRTDRGWRVRRSAGSDQAQRCSDPPVCRRGARTISPRTPRARDRRHPADPHACRLPGTFAD